MKCPGCGRGSFEGAIYCQYCGHDLTPQPVLAQHYPTNAEKRLDKRILMLGFALLAVSMIGTVVLSPLLISSESEERTITLDPYSHYAVRFDFYGIGMLRYTESQLSGSVSDVYLLELNQVNYHRFVSGEHYDYQGYSSLGIGGGGGISTESGTIWVRYLVFVNDNPEPATFMFGYHSTAFASLLVAGPLTASALLIFLCAVVVSKRSSKAV